MWINFYNILYLNIDSRNWFHLYHRSRSRQGIGTLKKVNGISGFRSSIDREDVKMIKTLSCSMPDLSNMGSKVKLRKKREIRKRWFLFSVFGVGSLASPHRTYWLASNVLVLFTWSNYKLTSFHTSCPNWIVSITIIKCVYFTFSDGFGEILNVYSKCTNQICSFFVTH